MRIRGEQMDDLSRNLEASFLSRMMVHLNKFFPLQCEALGEESIIDSIHYGVSRAAAYGIVAERDVCKYIDLMYALGRDYDRDPNYAWAYADLTNSTIPDPTSRINRVHDAALTRIRAQADTSAPPQVH